MFEKLWQFSSYIVNKGLNIIDASIIENITGTNIDNANKILNILSYERPKTEKLNQKIIR